MTDDPEWTLELPQRVAPAILAKQPEQVSEPAERIVVGGVAVAAELADVDRVAHTLDLAPRFVHRPQRVAVPPPTLVHAARIPRSVACLPAVPPLGAPMRDRVRLVAAAGVGDPEVAKFGHREVPAVEAVDDDRPVGVDRPDGRDRPPDDRRVVLAREAVHPDGRRLVDEIEAQRHVGNARVRRANPSHRKTKASWASCIEPQVVLLEVIAVDAVAGRAVQVEREVDAA